MYAINNGVEFDFVSVDGAFCSPDMFAFFKSYILQRGFLAKKEGFIISLYNANTAFYKYLKLEELNSKDKCF